MILVSYKDGQDGSLKNVSNVEHVEHDEHDNLYKFFIAISDGTRAVISLASSEVIPVNDEHYVVTRDIASDPLLDLEELEPLAAPLSSQAHSAVRTIPVIEEHLKVSHVVSESGRLRLDKHVEIELRDVPMQEAYQEAVIERRPCDRVLEEGEDAPHYSLEDGTLVIPVVEERAVVRIERVVVEEVMVKKVTKERSFMTQVELRKVHVDTHYKAT